MEENRLKPMVSGYDEQLFNRLYRETAGLRVNLAKGINPYRFGLSFEDILSFFDTKFIFCFNKHYDEPPEKLKAFLINALRNFKCRILRSAYTRKYSQNIVSIDGMIRHEVEDNIIIEKEANSELDLVLSFMKNHLSENAFLVLELQLNPPPFILNHINIPNSKKLQKIPDQLIVDYLGLGSSINALNYVQKLKKEIKNAISYAKISLN